MFGERTLFLGTGTSGGGYLRTYNFNGQETVYLGTGADSSGQLRVYDAAGETGTFLGSGYVPTISLATNTVKGCTPTCIDNIFTNSPSTVLLSGTCENRVSSHYPIITSFNISPTDFTPSDSLNPRYDYSDANMILLQDQLERKLATSHLTCDESGFTRMTGIINLLMRQLRIV